MSAFPLDCVGHMTTKVPGVSPIFSNSLLTYCGCVFNFYCSVSGNSTFRHLDSGSPAIFVYPVQTTDVI